MNFFSITARRIAAIAAGVAATGLIACTAFGLGVWVAVGQGNGAAGTIFYPLEFTNLSGHACSLFGFPGVSAIDQHGNQLGSSANREHTTSPRTVVLAPGATAHTILAYHDVAVTTEAGCGPVKTAALLKVYPPGQRRFTYAT